MCFFSFACFHRGAGLTTLIVLALLDGRPALSGDATTFGSRVYVSKGLVGVGRLAADLRDKFGETFGSGSGLVPDLKTWSREDATYRGTIYMLPDRGYNISGTEDYRARLNTLTVVLKPPADPETMPPEALAIGIVPAAVTTFIDINDNAQLNKFGLHNGEPKDRNDLYEKWEGMALLPALDPQYPHDYFLFVSNDNDFITQTAITRALPTRTPAASTSTPWFWSIG